jgi:hypothetical protein
MAKKRPPTLPPPSLPSPGQPAARVQIDLGCGPNKRAGFTGVDVRSFDGVDVVADLTGPWPWDADSVDEAHSSHFIEHLTGPQRIHFVNELHRVLKVGGIATLIAPHCFSSRAYGDLTHQWPPVSEFWGYYLLKEWRAANAPHNDEYTCDFNFQCVFNLHQEIIPRHPEYQQHASKFFKEAAQDIIFTLTKR